MRSSSARPRALLAFVAITFSTLSMSLATAPLHAQTVEGLVVEPASGAPLPGVHLRLLHPDDRVVASTFSDDSGRFHITAPDSGSWRLAADLLGYGRVLSDSIQLAPGQRVRVEIRMAVDPVRIEEPIVVIAEPPSLPPDLEDFHRRRKHGERTGIGHFIYGDAVERGVSGRPSDLLRMIPGVRVTTAGWGSGQIIRMRGGCIPALYIDGSRINRTSQAESLDTYVDVLSIEGIEVYRGAQQPAGRFFDRSGCGLVLVWTRRGEYDPEATFSWARFAIGVGVFITLLLLR